MSHISRIKLLVKNLLALRRAVRNLGLEFKCQLTYRWYGQWVGDYPLAKGLTVEDLGKCDYAIGIPNNTKAYEVGVKQMPDGSYALLWDFWNGGYGLQQAIGKNGCKLIAEYEAEVYKEVMTSQGYQITEEMLADGTRQIYATQY